MRSIGLEKFEPLLFINSIGDKRNIMQMIAEANNLEYKIVYLYVDAISPAPESALYDDELDSLLEHCNFNKDKHFAVYNYIFYKSRSIGMSLSNNTNNGMKVEVLVLNNINSTEITKIAKKTLKMKAFL